MSDDQQASQWQAIEQRVEHHRRALWRETQRWFNPPRVRVQKGRPGQSTSCCDITISDDGRVNWSQIDCDSD